MKKPQDIHMLLAKDCCVLVLDSLWGFGAPSLKDKNIGKEKKSRKHTNNCVTWSLVRDTLTGQEGDRIYKIRSAVEMRGWVLTASQGSFREPWAQPGCASKTNKPSFCVSCSTQQLLAMGCSKCLNFTLDQKWSDTKGSTEGRTIKCHWSLERTIGHW